MIFAALKSSCNNFFSCLNLRLSLQNAILGNKNECHNFGDKPFAATRRLNQTRADSVGIGDGCH